MGKFFDAEGNEVDAVLSTEVQTQVSTAVAEKEKEFTPKITELEGKLTEANAALTERAGEFKNFRKLTDDAVSKLSITERALYDNQVLLQEEREKNAANEKTRLEGMVDSTIKAKAGDNEKLAAKMKDMWAIFGIEASTTEQMDQKAKMILGAISQSEPDLVATVAGFNGSHLPPNTKQKEGESFADTERGKAAANDLGFTFETPKK